MNLLKNIYGFLTQAAAFNLLIFNNPAIDELGLLVNLNIYIDFIWNVYWVSRVFIYEKKIHRIYPSQIEVLNTSINYQTHWRYFSS